MRLAATLAATITMLLSASGDAVATAPLVPRMERVDHCSWDRPGHNPFMGDVVAAIDRYTEIPTPVRMRLKQRMQARQYDDLVDIRRDEIRGRARYEPAIRDMHFGIDRVCRQVSRAGWTARMHERGLVYCEAGHCILVPTVCRNVSRVERLPTPVAEVAESGLPDGGRVSPPMAAAAEQPKAEVGSAGAGAGAPVAPTGAMPFAEPAAGTNTTPGPADSGALPGGIAGNSPARGGGAAGGRGGSPPVWPLVSSGWDLGAGASGGSFGRFVGGLVQSGARIVPCLAHGGDRGHIRVASGWRVATGGRPARLAERGRGRSGPRAGFRRRPRRHDRRCAIARPSHVRAGRSNPMPNFIDALRRMLRYIGAWRAVGLAVGVRETREGRTAARQGPRGGGAGKALSLWHWRVNMPPLWG